AMLCSQSFREIVSGPKAPGEEVRVTFALSERTPVLCGRALDSRGVPLANQPFVGELDTEQQTGCGQASFTSNQDGRLRWHHDLGMVDRRFARLRLHCLAGEPRGTDTWAVLDGRQGTAGAQVLADVQLALGPHRT